MPRLHCVLIACLFAWCGSAIAQTPSYRVDYLIGFDPGRGEALVSITTTPGSSYLRRLRLTRDAARHSVFKGDGRVTRDGDSITWRPPRDRPGTLRFRYKVARERSDGSYDARITGDWALLRADRLIPPARVIASRGGSSQATLRFELPSGWSNAEIGYRFPPATDHFVIENPQRRFQQPVGWMIAGDVGTRRERISGMEVVVAAPKGQEMRRNDVLAFLNASLSEVLAAFGRLPPKLLIVGASDPMWRGGLSAPNSMYLHADRPLIGEAGTSPLLHELVHVVTRIRGARGQDWIAESFAEYYSIQLAFRSGLVSQSRTEKALALLREQGAQIRRLDSAYSSGPRTARGVTLLLELDEEIRRDTNGMADLDDVTRELVGRKRISLEQLRDSVRSLTGRDSRVLGARILGGAA